MMTNKIKTYSQWFPGEENDVSDSLSRDFHLSDDELTNLYLSQIPSQTPQDFNIRPLPQEIESWLYALLRQLPEMTQSPEQHQKSKLVHGLGGASLSNSSNMTKTNSSTNYRPKLKITSYHASHKLNEKHCFLTKLSQDWLREQSEVPLTMYHRPSETMAATTHGFTKMARLHDFYLNSIKATKTKTLPRNNKKPSQHA